MSRKITLSVRLAAMAAATMLSACAMVPYESALHTRVIQTWIGKDTATLWKTWGPPTRKLDAPDGSEYQVYFQKPALPAPGTSGTSEPEGPIVSDRTCETYFIVDRKTNKITGARWRGRGCPVSESSGIRHILGIPQPVGF